MNLNQVTVPCLDLEKSIGFYRRLGLRLIVHDPPNYARFECPSGNSTFSLHLADRVDSASAPVVYFEIEDLDRRVKDLEAAGLVFESEPLDQPWLWREAHLRDPAGNRLCLYHAGDHRRFPPWRLPGS
jgi:catechol 2,3-dioxygenase-like lactoylglutathione lyase family enzyme